MRDDGEEGDEDWLDHAPTQLRLPKKVAVESLEPGDLDDTDDGELPLARMTQKLPRHIDRRALPFEKPRGGARRGDARPAPFSTSDRPPGGTTWARAPGLDRPLDPSDLPSAHAPPSHQPAELARPASGWPVFAFVAVGLCGLVALLIALL